MIGQPDYSIRPHQGRQRKLPASRLLIEDEFLSVKELAGRLALSESVARWVLTVVQTQIGPVTWAKLRAERDRRVNRRRPTTAVIQGMASDAACPRD